MRARWLALVGGVALAVAAGLWWLTQTAPAPETAAGAARATPGATAPTSLRTLIRDRGEFAAAARLPGARIAVADPASVDRAWRPGAPFAPACTTLELAVAPQSIAYRALPFTVAASGVYYLGADFDALPGPGNGWPRFLYTPSFDPADPAGGRCRGGGAVLYAPLTAGVQYTLVTAGWMAFEGPPQPRDGAYADIVRPWVAPRDDLDGDGRSELVWVDATRAQVLVQAEPDAPAVRVIGYEAGEILSVIADVDGDRRQDLIWHDPGSGRTSYTPASLLAVAPQTRVELYVDPAWLPIAAGDLDGDGRADLVWINEGSGETHVWLMVDSARGATPAARATILTHPSWRVVAVADLDGDFRADLLWREAESGDSVYWLMAGLERRAEAKLAAPDGWRLVAAGDLNADGRADLVWVNEGERSNAVWLMDDSGRVPAVQHTLLADTDWRVVAAADVDGDARADLLWRHRASGGTAIWYMAGAEVRARREFSGPAQAELLAR